MASTRILPTLLLAPVALAQGYINMWVNPAYALQYGGTSLASASQDTIGRAAKYGAVGGPWSPTNSTYVPPSGDLRDYLSFAPYWWPNCNFNWCPSTTSTAPPSTSSKTAPGSTLAATSTSPATATSTTPAASSSSLSKREHIRGAHGGWSKDTDAWARWHVRAAATRTTTSSTTTRKTTSTSSKKSTTTSGTTKKSTSTSDFECDDDQEEFYDDVQSLDVDAIQQYDIKIYCHCHHTLLCDFEQAHELIHQPCDDNVFTSAVDHLEGDIIHVHE
ncbi:hypothetical protein EXIGLDRAFT_843282 [Exidia glandulosa HHB12029]|uniref:C2H2-type domain-containing protein n=1 Tax=Exidia glandulosa HHB12029 TaxID=1314781 RepID=A0A165CS71_EXIGL|nr:hypothetical protein EXIGLDRAFT_843282 [Exidia glandulosa HHB12029]